MQPIVDQCVSDVWNVPDQGFVRFPKQRRPETVTPNVTSWFGLMSGHRPSWWPWCTKRLSSAKRKHSIEARSVSVRAASWRHQFLLCVVVCWRNSLVVVSLVLARVEESVTIFSYLSGMYGWVLDGISSLFEPVTGPKPAELPSRSRVSGEDPTPPGWKAGAQVQENHGRPAKRNYQRSVLGVSMHILWCPVRQW